MKEIVPNSKRSKDQPKQNLVKKEDKTSVNVAYAFSAEVSKLKSISFKAFKAPLNVGISLPLLWAAKF